MPNMLLSQRHNGCHELCLHWPIFPPTCLSTTLLKESLFMFTTLSPQWGVFIFHLPSASIFFCFEAFCMFTWSRRAAACMFELLATSTPPRVIADAQAPLDNITPVFLLISKCIFLPHLLYSIQKRQIFPYPNFLCVCLLHALCFIWLIRAL